MNIPYLTSESIKDLNKSPLPLKIETYHFFKKRIVEVESLSDFSFNEFNKDLHSFLKPEDDTHIIVLSKEGVLGVNEHLKKYLSVEQNNGVLTLLFNTKEFFSHPSDFNLIILENDFSGTFEFKTVFGERFNTKNSYENSVNILHYQLFNYKNKSSYVFNVSDINNNPLNHQGLLLPENVSLPTFLNYYNINKFLSANYQDSNFVFNLSVPSKINFYQSEQDAILKNNVMVNCVSNKYTNSETKIDVNYFHCIKEGQLRDDSFEVNHVSSNFHSEINYFSLNKGTSVSQINTFIAPNAPKSKSHQHLKHVLLSNSANSFSKPNLMIENPDVESSHGNSMGGLNSEHLHYLKLRGISEERAKFILAESAIEKACSTEHFNNILKHYFKSI